MLDESREKQLQRCFLRRYLAIEIAATHITAVKSRVQEFAYLGTRFEPSSESLLKKKEQSLNDSFMPNVCTYVIHSI